MKALLHYRASSGFRRRLEALRPPWLSLTIVEDDDADAFRAEMRNSDTLLQVLTPVSAEDIAGAPRLKLIQKISVGVNT